MQLQRFSELNFLTLIGGNLAISGARSYQQICMALETGTPVQTGMSLQCLQRKFIEAKIRKFSQVEVWGDGKSQRSFLNIIDLAAATKFFVTQDMFSCPITNLNGERKVSIYDLAKLIKNVTEYPGEIIFDSSKPNGARRKSLNDDLIRKIGLEPKISLS